MATAMPVRRGALLWKFYWCESPSSNVAGNPEEIFAAVVPLVLDAGTSSVVNVASEAGLRGSAAGAAYTASNHAVVG